MNNHIRKFKTIGELQSAPLCSPIIAYLESSENSKLYWDRDFWDIIFQYPSGAIIKQQKKRLDEEIEYPEIADTYDDEPFIAWYPPEYDILNKKVILKPIYGELSIITITTEGGDDVSIIPLLYSVEGPDIKTISFSIDLPEEYGIIEDNSITFKKHYVGDIEITATAIDQYNLERVATKTIFVDCGSTNIISCEITDVETPIIKTSITSTYLNYSCNITVEHDGVLYTHKIPQSKLIEFENPVKVGETLERTGSFICDHGNTVNWTVILDVRFNPVLYFVHGAWCGNSADRNGVCYITTSGWGPYRLSMVSSILNDYTIPMRITVNTDLIPVVNEMFGMVKIPDFINKVNINTSNLVSGYSIAASIIEMGEDGYPYKLLFNTDWISSPTATINLTSLRESRINQERSIGMTAVLRKNSSNSYVSDQDFENVYYLDDAHSNFKWYVDIRDTHAEITYTE